MKYSIKACIFDLDGVIVDTAHYHYLSWKKLAKSIDFNLTLKENEKLKGVSRRDSLEHILNLANKKLSEIEINNALELKNQWYLGYVSKMTPKEILPGITQFLKELKENKIKLAIGSSSKNARPILERVKLINWFDVIVDGTNINNGKPNPEVFQNAAKELSLNPNDCLVIEDAIAGVEAALNAQFPVIAVGHGEGLERATHLVSSTKDLNFNLISKIFY